MSKQLANYERDKIIKAVIDKKIWPLREEIRKKKNDLSYKCFLDYLEKKLKGINIDHFPDGFFPVCKIIVIKLKGTFIGEWRLLSSQYKKAPFNLFEDHYRTDEIDEIKINLTNKKNFYYKEYSKLEKEKLAVIKKEDALRRELKGILYSVTTMKKLLTVWPEVEEYIDARDFYMPNQLALTPSVKKLNGMIKELDLVGANK